MTSPARLRAAAVVALVVLTPLGGCGSDTARDPGARPADPTAKPTRQTDADNPAAVARQLAVVTETAAGGTVDPTPVPLRDGADVTAYVAQFDGRRLARRIRQEVRGAELPDGQTLVASVVAVGCDVPAEVSILGPPGDLRIDAVLDRESPIECFAPMTSVALVAVGDDLLRG